MSSVCHLALPQRVGHDNVGLLLQQLQQQVQAQPAGAAAETVEIDVSALQQFDSSALALLLALLRTTQHEGRRWKVVNPSARLRDLATLYGLDDVLLSGGGCAAETV